MENINQLTVAQLRDVIITAHGMATCRYIQSDTIMRTRIGKLLEKTIEADDIMRGFLGRGGPCASSDIIGGTGSLDSIE